MSEKFLFDNFVREIHYFIDLSIFNRAKMGLNPCSSVDSRWRAKKKSSQEKGPPSRRNDIEGEAFQRSEVDRAKVKMARRGVAEASSEFQITDDVIYSKEIAW